MFFCLMPLCPDADANFDTDADADFDDNLDADDDFDADDDDDDLADDDDLVPEVPTNEGPEDLQNKFISL